MSGESETSSAALPKLTVAVFDHPDCPEWAKWAAVNANGKAVIFSYEPSRRDDAWVVTYYSSSSQSDVLGDETFDHTDWQNSLIERPKKSLPKLTEEVFNHPDCPEWAKYVAVDGDGCAYWFKTKPINGMNPPCYIKAWGSLDAKKIIPGFWDYSNWMHSLIECPAAKLPDWCKVGEFGYDRNNKVYFKIKRINNESIALQYPYNEDLESNLYIEFFMAQNPTQARLRPYNADEMKELVGKSLDHLDGDRKLITAYDRESEEVYADSMWLDSDELLSNGYTIDGVPCDVLEHQENGKWVE